MTNSFASELLRRMLDGLTDYGIVVLDCEGKVASWNAGAQRLTGYSADEVFGQDYATLFADDDRQQQWLESALRAARAEGRFEEDGWRRRKDGTRFWANVVLTASSDEAGRHLGFVEVTRDIGDRRAEDERLRLNEERFRMMIESVRDYAIYMLDSEGRVVSWNPGAERLKGYTAAEIIGRHFSVFYPEELRSSGAPEEELRIALERGRYEEEGWRVRKDGRRIWASVVLTPIRDARGAHIGFAKVTRDLSERRRFEAQRELVMARLENSNRELQDFAMVAAHDIQEPLRKIQLFSQQLGDEYGALLPDEARDYIARMQRAADRGRALVQGLLALSRVTTRAQPPVPTPLGEIVAGVVQDFESPTAAAGGSVVVGALPTVEADPTQMRQLFQNLVGNALKFQKPGVAPRVEIAAERIAMSTPAGGPTRWRITVADNGVGFDEKYVDRIFKLFQRLHQRSTYEGSGIGLAICRKIVERHGGTLTARSTPDVGTTFAVELPEIQPNEEESA